MSQSESKAKVTLYGNKSNIKYNDRQDKVNDKSYKPSTSHVRGPVSATSQGRHPSKENTKCYKHLTSQSTSQVPSIPKHYGTSSAPVHSKQ